MKSVEWKTYRTRFLIKAKQLSSALSFTDHLGRQHCGRKGDYLVESYDGVLSIAPRQIFEDVYVPMSATEQPDLGAGPNPVAATDGLHSSELHVEALKIEKIKITADRRVAARRRSDRLKSPRESRKPPQSIRAANSRLSLM